MTTTTNKQAIDPSHILPLLESLPFLDGVAKESLIKLGKNSQVLSFNQGQPLCRRHGSNRQLLLVLKGKVRLVVFSNLFVKKLATLDFVGPGQMLGWCDLVGLGQQESALASEKTTILAIPFSDLYELIKESKLVRNRITSSIPSSALFYILEKWSESCPINLADSLPSLCKKLNSHTKLKHFPLSVFKENNKLAKDHRWFVAADNQELEIGHELKDGEWPQDIPLSEDPKSSIRLICIPKTVFDQAVKKAIKGTNIQQLKLYPKNNNQQKKEDTYEQWKVRSEKILTLPTNDPEPLADPEPPETSIDKLVPEQFPWFEGKGVSGSACAGFRMLSSYFNMAFRKELFKRVFDAQEKQQGVSSLALCGAVAESIGLQSQLIKISASSIDQIEAPIMIGWGDGIAIIFRINREGIVLGVPAGSGNQLLTLEEFTEQWGEEGEIITLRKNKFTPNRKFGFKWFLPALKQHKGVLFEVLIASFFVQLFGLMNPLLIQQVIDKAIIKSSPDALGVLGLLLVVFAVFEGLLLSLRTFLFVDTTNRIDLSLGSSIIDHLLRLPLSFFDRRPVGEVSSRIGELEKIRSFLTGTALTAILDSAFSVIYIAVMFIYSWQLTLVTLSVVPLLLIITILVSPLIRAQIQKRAIANAKTQSHLVEVLSAMHTVKAQNIELRSRWKWQDLYTDYVAEGFDNTLTSTVASSASGFLNKLSGLLVIWVGAFLVLNGSLTLGGLIAFRIIAGYVTGPLLRMGSIWQNIQETNLSLERLSDVIDHPTETTGNNSQKISMPEIEGAISFNDIKFRYKHSSPLLLDGFNLEIPKGAFVGIVGTSGSGKSTLTKLLARLYDPEAGKVLIDGVDIGKVELYSLRRQIGIVPQETVLFDGSIEENIALTNPEATTSEIMEAARIAGAHDFIMELPGGYAHQVGERGSGLSGGQRQRIAVARTVLQMPNLLIMDEATSALDYQTERVVSENLMHALQDKTVLFITHRLSSITSADLIVCMGSGNVLEMGTHDELIARKGPYYVLYRQQGRSSSSSNSTPYKASGAVIGYPKHQPKSLQNTQSGTNPEA
jgi:ATP-binding cassette subfamily B protein